MKKYIVSQGNAYHIVGADGFVPQNTVCRAPENEDIAWLEIVDDVDEITGKKAVVNEAIKAQVLADRAAAKTVQDAIETAYNSMKTDIYNELYEVFRTKEPATATAHYETWKKMKEAPTGYSSLGLKVDHQVNNADGTELFDPGSALDTDQKVVAYATRKVEQAEAYGVYRMQRLQQFQNEKAALEGA